MRTRKEKSFDKKWFIWKENYLYLCKIKFSEFGTGTAIFCNFVNVILVAVAVAIVVIFAKIISKWLFTFNKFKTFKCTYAKTNIQLLSILWFLYASYVLNLPICLTYNTEKRKSEKKNHINAQHIQLTFSTNFCIFILHKYSTHAIKHNVR